MEIRETKDNVEGKRYREGIDCESLKIKKRIKNTQSLR